MKDDKKFEEALRKIGVVAGVGEDWYEIGEAEKDENGEVKYGIYAKTEAIADKVEKVLDRIFAERGETMTRLINADALNERRTDV